VCQGALLEKAGPAGPLPRRAAPCSGRHGFGPIPSVPRYVNERD